MGRAPSALSMVSVTSARPSGGREVVPAKTTSSILPPRSDLAPCSPMTQARASTMLDLPEPLGPTTQVMPGSRRSEVADAKDLKPRRVRLFRYNRASLLRGRHLAVTLPCGTVKCGPYLVPGGKGAPVMVCWEAPPGAVGSKKKRAAQRRGGPFWVLRFFPLFCLVFRRSCER